jgi:hypothetical protein
MAVKSALKQVADRAGLRVNQNLKYRPSYPLDRFLWLESKPLNGLIADISEAINEGKGESRKRDMNTEKKFQYALKVLVLNLLLTEKLPRKTELAVAKGAGDYTQATRYDSNLLAYRPFMAAYHGLMDLKLIQEATKGYWLAAEGKGKLTRIEPTNLLRKKLKALFPDEVIGFTVHPSKETIRLKDAKGKLKKYTDTPFTKKARTNLQTINGCLNRHWYDLDMTGQQFKEFYGLLQKRHKKESQTPATLNYEARSLYRVFNNGKFTQGGRFYGGWWEGIPSQYRKYITLNQKYTVEIDYSGFHPRMLYAIKGKDMGQRDPYVIDGILSDRDLGKLAFTKLLNGQKQLRKPDDFDEHKTGISWKEVLVAMEEYHSPIKEYFRTGYGLELQRKDADIADKILLHFAKRDTPCLPVHDSFIIHHALADELKDMMEQEYKLMFELEPKTKLDNYFETLMGEKGGSGEFTTSIDDLLKEDMESEYERRWISWTNQLMD